VRDEELRTPSVIENVDSDPPIPWLSVFLPENKYSRVFPFGYNKKKQ
jgi:hypothetical protein